MRTVAVALAVLLAACSNPDLPEGWEGATTLEVTQPACDGRSPTGALGQVQASAFAGGIDVLYRAAPFRCEQEVQAFVREREGAYEVLFQPKDLDPSSVVRCDCLYDLQASFEASAGAHTVTVWRRGDRYGGGEANPMQVGSAAVTVP